MSEKEISKFAKLIADDKVVAILNVAKDKKGLTSKEIAKQVQLPANQLYYTLKKMVAAQMLEVVEKKTINNFQEFFYSSYKMVHKTAGLVAQANADDPKRLSISVEWAKEHSAQIAQWVLYQNRQFLNVLQKNLEQPEKKQGDFSAFMLESTLELSATAEKKLEADLTALIKKAEDASSKEKNGRKVNILIQKWEDSI